LVVWNDCEVVFLAMCLCWQDIIEVLLQSSSFSSFLCYSNFSYIALIIFFICVYLCECQKTFYVCQCVLFLFFWWKVFYFHNIKKIEWWERGFNLSKTKRRVTGFVCFLCFSHVNFRITCLLFRILIFWLCMKTLLFLLKNGLVERAKTRIDWCMWL